jgi:hypothetical protein
MHGDADHPDEAVLTKADYERYDDSRHLFSAQLRGDFYRRPCSSRYGFNDPNVHYILARIRISLAIMRQHYWIPDATKNLKATAQTETTATSRYDLKPMHSTILVDDYADITNILRELNKGTP